MSESRINRQKKARPPGEGAEDRRDALKDALPDMEPPWAIKKIGKKLAKKGTASSSG